MHASRAPRLLVLTILAALLLPSVVPSGVGAVTATPLPLPPSMAAVGDSITRAASTAGTLGADAPANSWSTGTSTTVNSHYLRLLAGGAQISGQNHNRAVSGAKMRDLGSQMATLGDIRPDYVTVLMGGNDLCTDTVGEMTSVTDFGSQFSAAMTTLLGSPTTSGVSPNSHVYVVSIPDVYQLWSLFKGSFWARFIWSSADICQSLLANPTSTQPVDEQRRAEVRQRNIDYNAQLAAVCSAFARCHFDGGAVFDTKFAASDVSGEYFHPSIAGQAKLSSVSWQAGYSWLMPVRMRIGDLSGASQVVNGSNWRAQVTIRVTDTSGAAVPNATVNGGWTVGAPDTCTTGSAGTCVVTSDNLNRRKVASIRFTVSGATHATLVYDSAANVATQVTVSRP
jgi:GDSL-like Lipase/Acylhydrolase family